MLDLNEEADLLARLSGDASADAGIDAFYRALGIHPENPDREHELLRQQLEILVQMENEAPIGSLTVSGLIA